MKLKEPQCVVEEETKAPHEEPSGESEKIERPEEVKPKPNLIEAVRLEESQEMLLPIPIEPNEVSLKVEEKPQVTLTDSEVVKDLQAIVDLANKTQFNLRR